ncbi:MAG: response regulator, partial [Proteobacteria bacterium]|nr:response regulator [Pseudomonadota bacterium]
PEIPSLLKGDPGRLRQVILNLTNNAVKFTKKGEILLKVSLIKETKQKVTLKFAVKDTGIGITQKDAEKLFNSFQQVDASTTRKYGGTGLGLAISKNLAQLMGGEIAVESLKDMGSTFWFTAVFEKQLNVESVKLLTPDELLKKRMIVVDDNKTNLAIIQGYVESWGYECDTAWDPNMALTMMKGAAKYKAPYDILLSDWHMPQMDGIKLGEIIRQTPGLEKTIMIMLSSHGIRGDAALSKKIGFDAYLTKPVRSTQLFECLISVLTKKEMKTQDKPQLVTQHTLTEDKIKNIRILLAEDNAINRKIVLRLMDKWGFKIDAVENGKEAIKALEETRYDVVLMDVMMPEMDGLDATRAIRDPNSRVLDHNVLIIAMTAHAMKGDREMCIEAGMNSYLSKPIKVQEFYKILHEQLLKKDEENSGK